MTADDECGYCQAARLRRRFWRALWSAAALLFGLFGLTLAARFTGWSMDLPWYLYGVVAGVWSVRAWSAFQMECIPQRCPVTDQMIANAAIRSFAKHLHTYDTTIQREKLPSITQAFITQRRSSK